MTNVYILPDPDDDFGVYFWAISTSDGYEIAAEEPDYCNLLITLFRDEGETLEFCVTAWDLCECVLHSMLGTSL